MKRLVQHISSVQVLMFVIIATFFITSCASDPTRGYAMMSTFPADISTVAVPIFENETYEREIEFDLTDAVIKQIESTTPYKVVPESRAETVLIGRITDIDRERLSKSRLTGLSEEDMLRVTIHFEWIDTRSDELLVERRNFQGDALFVPSRPAGEPIELARFAVVEQLAGDIVDQMRAKW